MSADVVTALGLDRRLALPGAAAVARLELPAGRAPGLCRWVLDPGGRYAYTHTARVRLQLNRGAVADQGAPGSLAELAGPRWKGKVALLSPSDSYEADCLYRFIADHPALGFAWLEKMRENEVTLFLSVKGVLDAVRYGVRPVGWGVPGLRSDPMRKETSAAPVKSRPAREGSVLLLYATAINRRAPHPEAARVFVGWLLEPATRRYLVENGLSHDALLEGDCERLGREPVCGRSLATGAKEAEALRRRVWEALQGERHIPR